MISLSQLVPGVRPTSDFLVFEVQSESRPSLWHRVDFACYSGWGACSCENFQFQIDGRIKKSTSPTEKMQCPHMHDARRYLAIMVAQGAIKQRAGESNPVMSRKEWGNTPF